MLRSFLPCLLVSLSLLCSLTAFADTKPQAASGSSLTIYNQQFAVVRQSIPLDLTGSVDQIAYSDITCHLEPDSVILRDPTGHTKLQVIEQNYRGDTLSQSLLLSHYEGKTIDFQVAGPSGQIVQGKIIRSGYIPNTAAYYSYGSQYQYQQSAYASASAQPVIEVNGKLMFELPGTPLFPALTDDSILKPELDWKIQSDKPGKCDAELAYVTGGMSWQAAYNVVAPETGDALDLTGWVTIDNQTGKDFDDARIKLMAGDVNKIRPQQNNYLYDTQELAVAGEVSMPVVTQKAFDEYHLYSLPGITTLRDRETKQIEFVHSPKIASREIYIYDGVNIDPQRYGGWGYDNIRSSREYGTDFTPKVAAAREFDNTEANGLGVPIPAGRLRFYRRDSDGQLEFTGESTVDHTPKGETIRATTGYAFDLVGDRKQTDYHIDSNARNLDESFAITLKNHKEQAVDIRVIEHLYRGMNWTIPVSSMPFFKTDAHTVEFTAHVPANGQSIVTYSAHYTW